MRTRLIIALNNLQLQNNLTEIVSAQDTQVECCGHLANPWQSTEIVGDLNTILPVDLIIPGCPPHPLSTLHALLNFFK